MKEDKWWGEEGEEPLSLEAQILFLQDDIAYREEHWFGFADRKERRHLRAILKSLQDYRHSRENYDG